MGKKYVPISQNNRKFCLYINDIKRVHKSIVKKFPPIPIYIDQKN